MGSTKFCISRTGHFWQILPCSLLGFDSRALDPTWQLLTWYLQDAHRVIPYCSFSYRVLYCVGDFSQWEIWACVWSFPLPSLSYSSDCACPVWLCVGRCGYVMNIQRCVIKVIQVKSNLLSPLLSDKSGRRTGQTRRHGGGKSRRYDCFCLIAACTYIPFLSSMVKLGKKSQLKRLVFR